MPIQQIFESYGNKIIAPAVSESGGEQVQSDWSQADASEPDYIKNKPSLSAVATSGDYEDLSNTPTIPDISGKVNKSGDTMSGQLNIDRQNGSSSSVGGSQIWLGNNIPEGTDKNSRGVIRLYGKGAYYSEIYDDTGLTAHRSLYLPNKSGTFALTSDVDTKVSKSGDTISGNLTLAYPGTTSAEGYSELRLGNNIPVGTDGNSHGIILMYGRTDKRIAITADRPTADRTITLPDKDGIVALTSDIFYVGDRKIINISVEGTGTSVDTAVQDVLNAIDTESKYCYVRALQFKSGARYLSGYVYPNKNYGSFILQDYLHCYFCSINNSVISYTQII